jgi:hydroxymethylbilane synthase
MRIRLGARGSALSLAQLEIVRRALADRVEISIETIRTTGDRLSRLDASIVGKGVFTKEIDEALLEGRIDVGVHSLKDLPAEIPAGLALAAVPLREDARDALVAHPARPFGELPRGARIGTSSPRRRAQLLAARPDLSVLDARGNVDTRIRRLHEGRWDAIVLARAGLVRLGRLSEACDFFATDVMIPAIGQGALALVVREDDASAREVLASLDDAPSHREVLAERALLSRLQAGCRAPLAGHARTADGSLELVAAVYSEDGSRVVRERATGPLDHPESLGDLVAEALLARGAADLVAQARS